MMANTSSWKAHFDEIQRLLESSRRHYGIANSNFTDMTIERLNFSIQSVVAMKNAIEGHISALSDYKAYLDSLNSSLRSVLTKWKEYRNVLDSTSAEHAFQVSEVHIGRCGRPKFDISKEQIEYLLSLSFTWIEIATLLGISRMILYRYSTLECDPYCIALCILSVTSLSVHSVCAWMLSVSMRTCYLCVHVECVCVCMLSVCVHVECVLCAC